MTQQTTDIDWGNFGLEAGPIRSVHLELTTRCNARCPMCARTGRGRVRPGLRLTELSLADIRAIFPPEIARPLTRIDVCGGFGDPLMAAGFDDIMAYFREENPNIALNLFTNGGLRPKAWWRRLSGLLGHRARVIFGIDGLQDTHAIYRVGTRFETVLENARAFIEAGGQAQWDFLIFRHNQHQVEQARRLANEIGFAAFSPKVSGRFFKRFYEEVPGMSEDEGYETFPIFAADGSRAGKLEFPTEYLNPTLVRMREEVGSRGGLQILFDAACISCRAVRERSCFVSAEGTVFPCCWTYGASKYGTVFGMRDEENLRVARLLEESGGPEAIDARLQPLPAILDGSFFRRLAASWNLSSVARGKPKICARMCGGSLSQEDQFLEPGLSPWQASKGAGSRGR